VQVHTADTNVSDPQLFDIRRQARLEVARRAAQRKDILEWGKALFPEKFNLPFCCALHGYFVDIRGDDFTNTKAPRNHAKTAIKCFLIPLFQALEEPDTFQHYLNVQATREKALAINASIMLELEENDLLRELYGDMKGERWTASQFVLANGVVFTAISAGQSIRGINYRQIRPDYILVDDLYNEEDINNIESTMKKNAWLMGSLYPARAKSRKTSFHVQGTAINHYDILSKLEKDSTVKSRTFKAIKRWATDTVPGEVLWPELNTYESLMIDMTRMGSVIFFRELQNEPRDEASAIIKYSWLYPTDGKPSWEYDPATLKFDQNLRLVGVFLLCDPSIGEKEQNDFTAVILMLVAQYADGSGNIWYIHDAWNEQLSLDKRIKLLKDAAAEQPNERGVTQVRIESIAGFKDFTAEVKRRTNLPVKEIDHVKDKIANLESKSHFFENGKVKINSQLERKLSKDGITLKDMIVYQLTMNYPQHDDLRDGVLLGLDAQSGVWNFVS
jgi:hypothetical protein